MNENNFEIIKNSTPANGFSLNVKIVIEFIICVKIKSNYLHSFQFQAHKKKITRVYYFENKF